jgi:hypothetical protein
MSSQPHKNPRLIPTLRDDIAQGGFFAKLKREAEDIEDFYLNEEERARLKEKGRIWRWFVLAWWVVKNSFFRLSPVRRLLLVFGLVMLSLKASVSTENGGLTIHYGFLGLSSILLVLLLELKDKLLAHGELESGRAVQRAMNPEQTPSVPGWDVWLYTRSANEVGGDLVDFQPLAGGRFGIAIGDVAGKGLGAALFMVKIQATLRALAPDYDSPAVLAAKVNDILLRDGMPTKFASLLFIRIDSDTGRLAYVNAGHMPPLLVSPNGVTEMPKGNVALGLSGDAAYADQELPLLAGQTFVVYSDGLTEAQNRAGEFYGLARLKSLGAGVSGLSAKALGERMVADVARFEGDARRNDDLSLVIIRRASSG